MKRRAIYFVLAAAVLMAALAGCSDDTPTITELASSDAVFTVDACSLAGTYSGGVLSMQVDYTVTNHTEGELSELVLLTPHLEERPMVGLELAMDGETYPLQTAEKDTIALDEPVAPGEQKQLCITYQVEDLPLPEGGGETWRITVPTLEKSATATGIGKVLVSIAFDEPVSLKSSLPIGLEQAGETEITGELGNLVNLLVLELQ